MKFLKSVDFPLLHLQFFQDLTFDLKSILRYNSPVPDFLPELLSALFPPIFPDRLLPQQLGHSVHSPFPYQFPYIWWTYAHQCSLQSPFWNFLSQAFVLWLTSGRTSSAYRLVPLVGSFLRQQTVLYYKSSYCFQHELVLPVCRIYTLSRTRIHFLIKYIGAGLCSYPTAFLDSLNCFIYSFTFRSRPGPCGGSGGPPGRGGSWRG